MFAHECIVMCNKPHEERMNFFKSKMIISKRIVGLSILLIPFITYRFAVKLNSFVIYCRPQTQTMLVIVKQQTQTAFYQVPAIITLSWSNIIFRYFIIIFSLLNDFCV